MDPRPESWMNAEVSTGTTIMACVFAGGVVVGADSRVSTGTYVSNRASDKITPLADNVFLCRSGSAADTQLVSDYVRYFAQQHSMELEGEISVKTVANLTKSINYNNKHLSAAMIVGGYDSMRGGQVYSLPIGGTVVPCNWTVDGSGSTYIWGEDDEKRPPGQPSWPRVPRGSAFASHLPNPLPRPGSLTLARAPAAQGTAIRSIGKG